MQSELEDNLVIGRYIIWFFHLIFAVWGHIADVEIFSPQNLCLRTIGRPTMQSHGLEGVVRFVDYEAGYEAVLSDLEIPELQVFVWQPGAVINHSVAVKRFSAGMQGEEDKNE